MLGGCGLAEHPFQPEATNIVWNLYQAQGTPPPIEWREDACPGKMTAAVVLEGACYAGIYLRGCRALVAWRGRFSTSAFAHELMHAAEWSRGVEDPEHLIEKDWTLARKADELLAQEGL